MQPPFNKMKKLILILVYGFLIWSCNEQAPTQLLDDTQTTNEEFEVEVLPREQNIFDYASDYDSTGIIEPSQVDYSVITANGIKNTFKNVTIRQAYFETVLLDKSMPLRHKSGRIIGFMSNTNGNVKFNNELASVVQRKISIMKNGIAVDTIAGTMFQLKKRYLFNNPNRFPYGSNVQFEYEKSMMGNHRMSLNIPTPNEISGEIQLEGSRNTRNLKAKLNWNPLSNDNIEIIIGGTRNDKIKIKPLFRIRTKDDGELIIPWSFLRTIPFQEFDQLIISFERVRKNKITNQIIGESLVVSKSIHNIRFEIP